jgi:hypothetical protein
MELLVHTKEFTGTDHKEMQYFWPRLVILRVGFKIIHRKKAGVEEVSHQVLISGWWRGLWRNLIGAKL